MILPAFVIPNRAVESPIVPPVVYPEQDIYIKIRGQSNAQGRALWSDLTEDQQEASYYNDIYIFKPGSLSWPQYYPRGPQAETITDNFGVECFLGVLLRDYYEGEKKVMIDKRGQGGTSLFEVEGQDWNLNSNELWLQGKNYYTNAISIAPSFLLNPSYKVMIWWQGESDALVEEHANAYYNNLVDIINDERSFVSNAGLKIIDVGISPSSGSYASVVNAAKAQIATEDVNYLFIDTSDMGIGTHPTTSQVSEIAVRIFNLIKDEWT